jgi:hypothetical protein
MARRAEEALLEVDNQARMGEVRRIVGLIDLFEGKFDQAEGNLRIALASAQSSGSRLLEAEVLADSAQLALLRGNQSAALALTKYACELFMALSASERAMRVKELFRELQLTAIGDVRQ